MMAQEMICVWFSALTQSPTHTIHDAETADVPLQQALLVSRLPGCRFLSSSYSRRTSCPTCLAYGPRGTCIFLSVRVVAELLPQVPDCRQHFEIGDRLFRNSLFPLLGYATDGWYHLKSPLDSLKIDQSQVCSILIRHDKCEILANLTSYQQLGLAFCTLGE